MGVQAKDMKHQACLVRTEGVLIPPASQPEPHNPVRACPSPGTLPGEDPQRLLEEEVAGGQAGQPLGPPGAAWGPQTASVLLASGPLSGSQLRYFSRITGLLSPTFKYMQKSGWAIFSRVKAR